MTLGSNIFLTRLERASLTRLYIFVMSFVLIFNVVVFSGLLFVVVDC